MTTKKPKRRACASAGRCNKIVYRQHGGKSTLASWIVSHFPEHRVYVEPFCGSCAVLFAKPPSFTEIVNDLDGEIANMYRVLRERPKELAALLWATPYSQADWRDTPVNPDDLERARIEIARTQQFYGGRRSSSTFSVDKSPAPHKPKAKVWADWFQRILPAAARLKDVTLLNEDAVQVINRVKDEPQSLIYVDPPYLGHEDEYNYRVDYEAMVEALRACKGKVIVSEFEAAVPYFKGWKIIRRATASRCGAGRHGGGKKKTELLFENFN